MTETQETVVVSMDEAQSRKRPTARGWSSNGLQTVGYDAQLWTAENAAKLLGPPYLSTTQVRALIRCANLQPAGKRRTTDPWIRGGRHSRVYRADELIRLYESLFQINPEAG